MPRASILVQAAAQGAVAYRDRVGLHFYARVRRDALAAMFLAAGRGDPYPRYAQLASNGPIGHSAIGSYYTTDHAVCREVLGSRRFGAVPESGRAAKDVDTGADLSLLQLNPPDHTRLRRLVAPAFGPRRMATYRESVERIVDELIDGMLQDAPTDGEWDLVERFTAPLPLAVITELLGIPDYDRERFLTFGAAIGGALDGLRSPGHAYRVGQAARELETVFERLFALREREPADDLVTTLVAARAEDRITPTEMVPLCTLLLLAGFETTVNLIANAVVALHAHTGQWRILVEDTGLAGQAVEETLRFAPAVTLTGRFALEDVELSGRSLRRDDGIVLLLAATGRDPAVYARPNLFDLTRTQEAEHLAFSAGAHYCLGAPLARLEASVALAALARRMPTMRVRTPVPMHRTLVLRGPRRLRVRV